MKTAQQLIDDRKFDKDQSIELQESDVINLMKEYARQACEEQRQIIIEEYKQYTDIIAIINAPEAELK